MGNSDFSQLLKDLRCQVTRLKERCAQAENRISELVEQDRENQVRIGELTAANQELTQRFQNLQASSTGRSADETEALRERYLAMIREIDDCIAKLNKHQS